MPKRKQPEEFLNTPAMALVRQKIHKEFCTTPDEGKPSFCVSKFGEFMNKQNTIEDDQQKERYLAFRFMALELAVSLDAGRRDLWNAFMVQMSDMIAPVIRDLKKKKREERNRKKEAKGPG